MAVLTSSILSPRKWLLTFRAAIFITCCLALSGGVFAQTTDTATIRGRVLDQNGAAISGGEVAAINQVTGLRRETRTDQAGNYVLANLPLTGAYRLHVASSGFAASDVNNVELRAGEAASIDVTLVPQGGTSVVTVFGTTEGVQSDSPQLGTRLDLKKIDNTPVFGRKITYLATLNSAVRPARGTGDQFMDNFLFVINGAGRRQTSFILDGSTNDDAWGRQTVFTSIPFSAIQEFTIVTNPISAEYGRTAGGVVNIVTKSGTNDYHLDIVGLWRPGGIEARAPLATARTPDTLGQFSGVVSGPITRNRTFFLAGAEYNDQKRASVITSPRAPGVFTGRYEQGLVFARLDHQLNAANLLTARFNFDRFTDTNPADAVGGLSLPSAARTFRKHTYEAQVSETAQINPRVVNEARFALLIATPITQFDPVQPSTQFVRTGLSTEGESRSADLINHEYQFADTLSLTFGRHLLRVGGDAIFSTSGGFGTEFGSGFLLGQFTFSNNFADVRNPAVPTSALPLSEVQRFTQSFGTATYNVREWLSSVFAQDNWRVRRNLTLNLGLRYERQTFTDDKNNFAPRAGFAWNPFGDDKTVARGSYGIYYSEVPANNGAQFALNGPTGVFTFSAAPGQPGFPSSFAPLAAFPPGAVLPPRDIVIRPGRAAYYSQFFDVSKLRGYPAKLLNPYTQQATLGIERELPNKWFLAMDYVYAHTLRITRLLDLNAPSLFIPTAAVPTRSAAAADATRPITPVANGYRRIQALVNQGSAVYNGMQLNLNKRFSRDFSLLVSYTWSHTINTVEADAPGGDPLDVNLPERAERGDSLLDQRHRAVISGWWQLPFRLTLGGIATLASGRPYNITSGVDINGDASNVDRPFDLASGTFLGRNTGRGKPTYDFSMFAERALKLGERAEISLRAEAFNLFNHPNILAFNGVLTSPTFGQGIGGVNGVEPGREFQFQLRFRY